MKYVESLAERAKDDTKAITDLQNQVMELRSAKIELLEKLSSSGLTAASESSAAHNESAVLQKQVAGRTN